MLFNSIEFLLFFPVVVALYFAIPHKYRWALLLAASWYFYMCWKAEYIILIIVSTAVDYYAGLKMSALKKKKQRKPWLYLSLVVNLAILFGFKYFNFFNDSTRAVFETFNLMYHVPEFKVLLPVGISFYTFQTLSYSIDIYKGTGKVERHPGIFALYVSFFPQLVAGPIERSTNLLPQFREKHAFSYGQLSSGLKLMLWGMFKKVVIADRIGIFVHKAYSDPSSVDNITLVLASFFFLIQLYCDFSGYSDIAIGSARTMGYRLMKNFDRPMIARNITDFWNRWHISLNTWFRDYVLFAMPFGKNKKLMRFRLHVNMVITILLIGLWHGANWTYVLWGASIALIMIVDSLTKNFRASAKKLTGLTRLPRFASFLDIFSLFFVLSLSAILFRTQNASDISAFYSRLFVFPDSWVHTLRMLYRDQFILILVLTVFIYVFEYFHAQKSVAARLSGLPVLIRYAAYSMAVIIILLAGVFTEEEFIYFQF